MSVNSHDTEKVRSLFISFIIDFVLFLPDIVAALLSGSVTMLADVFKCGCELLAAFFSWLALRKISRGAAAEYEYGIGKLENLTSVIVAAAMVLSLAIIVSTAVIRTMNPVILPLGATLLGVFLMAAGIGMNTWLWIKNYRIACVEYSPIMESEWRLFRAKALADSVVFLALVMSLSLNKYAWAHYIDPVASLIIAGFLTFSIYAIITHSVYDLLDKTLDEGMQLIIIKKLVAFFDNYVRLHGVRSRRSGGDIFIEIFLEFDGERKMHDVQTVINAMKNDIEGSLQGSFVSIIPTTERVDDR
ncbi:MAG: cation diffusion facilitator family transporter [Syntrophales bacterium]|nr:cation diffusion facilitator family transporter [Syntrophales bacterium]